MGAGLGGAVCGRVCPLAYVVVVARSIVGAVDGWGGCVVVLMLFSVVAAVLARRWRWWCCGGDHCALRVASIVAAAVWYSVGCV